MIPSKGLFGAACESDTLQVLLKSHERFHANPAQKAEIAKQTKSPPSGTAREIRIHPGDDNHPEHGKPERARHLVQGNTASRPFVLHKLQLPILEQNVQRNSINESCGLGGIFEVIQGKIIVLSSQCTVAMKRDGPMSH